MQTTPHVLMIRPVRFGYNAETAVNNAFQKNVGDSERIQQEAQDEFDAYVGILRANDVDVMVVEDTAEPYTPDSIFPNNWISFHEDGTVCLYPMFAENRRLERRKDIVELVGKRFEISRIEDFTMYEQQAKFLEGTGSMILDRDSKVAYACLSPRTDRSLFSEFCRKLGYQPVCFTALDVNRQPIYHTNVMMSVADCYAIVCVDSVSDKTEQQLLIKTLEQSGKQVVDISQQQLQSFAGNMLQVKNLKGQPLLLMSDRAYQSLTSEQLETLTRFNKIIHPSLENIEVNGGGSARCMVAEIFLPQKVKN